jgi:hypothetical protein
MVGGWLWCVTRVNQVQAGVLGGWLIFALASVASYDYCWMLLLFAWTTREQASGDAGFYEAAVLSVMAVAAGVALASSNPIPAYEPAIYPALAMGVLAVFGLWCWRIARKGDAGGSGARAPVVR